MTNEELKQDELDRFRLEIDKNIRFCEAAKGAMIAVFREKAQRLTAARNAAALEPADNFATARRHRNDLGLSVHGDVKIDEFLHDLKALCERYKMWISHEDSHGGFEIVSDNTMDWVNDASDARFRT